MDMYIKRILFITTNIYNYVGNIILYKIYGYKKKMDIDTFHQEIKNEYFSILRGDVTKSYNSYKKNIDKPNHNDLDYKECIDYASNATNRLIALKTKIDKFKDKNKPVKTNIDKLCNILKNDTTNFSNYSCDKIYANYNYE
jgi:hypothetical protein